MKKNKSVFTVAGYIILIVMALLIIFPIMWLFVSSFKSDADVIKWPPLFFPSKWTMVQYNYVLKVLPMVIT